jgi:hypothetical protein
VQVLSLPGSFNRQLGELPNTLTMLILGSSFNQDLTPNEGLTHLHISTPVYKGLIVFRSSLKAVDLHVDNSKKMKGVRQEFPQVF